jgi:RNA polymerase sigma-70 factor, ECF subfamily
MSPGEHRDTVAAAKTGDRDALALIWRAWNARLLRYLAGRGAPSPDDLAADIWIEVARNLGRCPDDEPGFGRFLFTVARNRLVDEYRRVDRSREVLGALPDAPGRDDASGDVLARLDLDETLALIRRLPDDQAEAILLRVVAGLDVAETAQVMGRSAGSVRVLAHRGLRSLQKLVVTQRERSSVERVS